MAPPNVVFGYHGAAISFDAAQCLDAHVKLTTLDKKPILHISVDRKTPSVFKRRSIRILLERCAYVYVKSAMIFDESGRPDPAIQSTWQDKRRWILPKKASGYRRYGKGAMKAWETSCRYIEICLQGVPMDLEWEGDAYEEMEIEGQNIIDAYQQCSGQIDCLAVPRENSPVHRLDDFIKLCNEVPAGVEPIDGADFELDEHWNIVLRSDIEAPTQFPACNPAKMLKVRLEPSNREYELPRGTACAKSEYFSVAFEKESEGNQSGVIIIKDVAPWIFECFDSWLDTDRVFWNPNEQPDPAFNTPASEQDDAHENDKSNAVTWQWNKLIQLFIFADQYGIKEFRNAIMVNIQLKALMSKPRKYPVPSHADAAQALRSLASASSLYSFIVDSLIYSRPLSIDDAPELLAYPPEALSLMLIKSVQAYREGKSSPLWNHCRYHEHENDEEGLTCRRKMELLEETCGIKEESNPSSKRPAI